MSIQPKTIVKRVRNIKMKNENLIALKEHMLSDNSITNIEALMLFGIQSLTATITRLKRDGFIIKSHKVTMISILKRLNQYCICKAPSNLPTKEILVTEYWVSK